MKINIVILIALFIFPVNTLSKQTIDVGEYSVHIESEQIDHGANKIVVDFYLNIHLPKGDGTVYIPLPIDRNDEYEILISPDSTDNLILHGFLREYDRYALFQINLISELESTINVVIKNVYLRMHKSDRSRGGQTIKILFREASSELVRRGISTLKSPGLTKISFKFSGYKDSRPISESINNSISRVINVNNRTPLNNVIIYLEKSKNEVFLYIMLGVMGISIGYFTAPKFVSSKNKAQSTLVVSILISLVAVGIFVRYFSEIERLTDTTTIVTFGSVFGLIIGILMNSIQFLVTQNHGRGED